MLLLLSDAFTVTALPNTQQQQIYIDYTSKSIRSMAAFGVLALLDSRAGSSSVGQNQSGEQRVAFGLTKMSKVTSASFILFKRGVGPT